LPVGIQIRQRRVSTTMLWRRKREYLRPHMERDNLPPLRDVPDEIETLALDNIEGKSYVGDLVKSFERKAA
jgi:hypothetical protein